MTRVSDEEIALYCDREWIEGWHASFEIVESLALDLRDARVELAEAYQAMADDQQTATEYVIMANERDAAKNELAECEVKWAGLLAELHNCRDARQKDLERYADSISKIKKDNSAP